MNLDVFFLKFFRRVELCGEVVCLMCVSSRFCSILRFVWLSGLSWSFLLLSDCVLILFGLSVCMYVIFLDMLVLKL